jgi:antitoxin component of MazEF toxin-antitoxin module
MSTKLRLIGREVALVIPDGITNALGLKCGTCVQVILKGREFRVRPMTEEPVMDQHDEPKPSAPETAESYERWWGTQRQRKPIPSGNKSQ